MQLKPGFRVITNRLKSRGDERFGFSYHVVACLIFCAARQNILCGSILHNKYRVVNHRKPHEPWSLETRWLLPPTLVLGAEYFSLLLCRNANRPPCTGFPGWRLWAQASSTKSRSKHLFSEMVLHHCSLLSSVDYYDGAPEISMWIILLDDRHRPGWHGRTVTMLLESGTVAHFRMGVMLLGPHVHFGFEWRWWSSVAVSGF